MFFECFCIAIYILSTLFVSTHESLALANLTGDAFELAHVRLAHCLANELDAALNSCLIKILYLTLTGDLLI